MLKHTQSEHTPKVAKSEQKMEKQEKEIKGGIEKGEEMTKLFESKTDKTKDQQQEGEKEETQMMIKKLEEEKQQLAIKIDEIEHNKNELLMKVDELQKEKDEQMVNTQKEKEVIEKKVGEFENQIKLLQKKVENLEHDKKLLINQIEEVKNEKELLQKKLEEQQTLHEQTESERIASLKENSKQQICRLEQQVESEKKEKTKQIEFNQTIQKERDVLMDKNKDLTHKITEADKNIQIFKFQIDEFQMKIKELSGKKDENGDKENMYRKEVEKMQQTIETYQLEIQKLKEEAEKQNYTINTLSKENLKMLNKITYEFQEKYNLNLTISGLRKEKGELHNRCDQLKTDKEEMELTIDDMYNECYRLNGEIEKHKKQIEELKEQVESEKKEKTKQIELNQKIGKERDILTNTNKNLTQKMRDEEVKKYNDLVNSEDTQKMHSNEIYLTIEEVYSGCQKMITTHSSKGTEVVVLVILDKGIKEGEVIEIDNVNYVVKYIEHPYLSRRGDDLVVNKSVFITNGVRHPASSRVLMKNECQTLLSLKGFTEQGKTLFDDGSVTC
ncbi:paramyosin, putative [Entamoeba invadens IP1]|uniref:Paramyosin, putative n=1 Tax=Entamoeba invadens IP1 TaxID=370355 RepID=A0A0A1TXG2_ENTIV|nr:paramyosin, putative [Entamoeba invadens IP1]ELP85978.1 paramyosin, putative [Entamoeba invadens IP1]|eukprot:XP_004185324.1 paramyosin, putative [Entamoeba invadens IP1]